MHRLHSAKRLSYMACALAVVLAPVQAYAQAPTAPSSTLLDLPGNSGAGAVAPSPPVSPPATAVPQVSPPATAIPPAPGMPPSPGTPSQAELPPPPPGTPLATGAASSGGPAVQQPVQPSGPADITNTVTKNPDLMPIHLSRVSLMYTKKEMDLIAPFIDAYSTNHVKKPENSGSEEDFGSLLSTLKHDDSSGAPPPRLPNLYLGSILYYSPSHWSIWLNGKKLGSEHNATGNEYYITQLSRDEMELQWHPASLMDVPTVWRQRTDNGKQPLDNILVDENKGLITLHLRPNQTFVPRYLAIHEGMLVPDTTSTPSETGSSPPPEPTGSSPPPAVLSPADAARKPHDLQLN